VAYQSLETTFEVLFGNDGLDQKLSFEGELQSLIMPFTCIIVDVIFMYPFEG